MKNSGPLEDRILIRELYGLYGDASCRGSVEDWLELWTEDGVWNSHIFECTGKAALRAQWNALWENFASLGFLSELGPVEVTGDTARARSYAREIIRLKDGGLFKLIGAYEDQMVRRNGTWLFARRDYRPLVEELPQQ
jgi:hypothetical protein